MAEQVWGYDSNNMLVNINDIEREVECSCIECGAKLIQNRGEKKKWYFRHKIDSECIGASGETIVHKVAKQLLLSGGIHSIYVPSACITIFKDKVVDMKDGFELLLSDGIVNAEKYISNGMRPDIAVEYDDTVYFLEIDVTHRKSPKDINKYHAYAMKNPDKKVYVLEAHLKKFKYLVDDESFTTRLAEFLAKRDSWHLIYSKNLRKLQNIIKESTLYSNSAFVACPASRYNTLMSAKQCKGCAMFIRTEGNIRKCYGLGGITKESDIISLVKGNIPDYDTLMDIHQDELPSGVSDILPIKEHYFGYDLSGNACTLMQGDSPTAPRLKNMPVIRGTDTEYGYIVDSFNKRKVITCPYCNSPMKLLKNSKNGKVFLSCENYKKVALEEGCHGSITIYTDDTCSTYEDEIIAVGDLSLVFTNPSLVRRRLKKCRADAVRRKGVVK